MAVFCYEVDSIDDKTRFGIIHDPVQANTTPSWLHTAMPFLHDISIAL